MLKYNWLALVITFFLALIWLRLNDLAAHRGWINSRLSRKIIHMGTGPLYVLCWPLFSDSSVSPFLAALVPLSFSLQFALIGFGVIKDEASVQAMSRTGDRREILRGPLFYGIIFVTVTIAFWLRSPIGIVALMLMCGGDGLADILGRKYGKRTLPWAPNKTWIGSLGMFVGGWIFSTAILFIFIQWGIFSGSIGDYLLPITVISSAGTLVESLPFRDIDNITVTVTAILIGLAFWA
jgi:phytol kinase